MDYNFMKKINTALTMYNKKSFIQMLSIYLTTSSECGFAREKIVFIWDVLIKEKIVIDIH